MGLYLLRRALDALGGDITFAKGELGGALFTVIIPKGRNENRGA
jgi:two-component system CitB family sensor kinase/two-component system sensor histidine kinase DcuS